MNKNELATTALHKVPADLQETLLSTEDTRDAWNDITPIARNEWVCWVTSAKKPETRNRRIKRTQEDLSAGKRRPCCWPGCPHR